MLIYNAWNDLKTFSKLSRELPLLWLMKAYDPTSDPFLYPQGLLDEVLIHSQVYVKIRNRYLVWKFAPGLEGAGPSGRAKSAYDPLALRQYELNLQLFVDACRNIGALPILVTQASRLLIEDSTSDQTEIRYDYLELSPSAADRAMREANQVMRDVATEKQVALIDLGPQLSRQELLEDHVHLNEAGRAAVSLAVADFLEELLETSPPRAESP